MTSRARRIWLPLLVYPAVFFVAGVPITLRGASINSFADIDDWVGEGSNQAALVIDWLDGSTDRPALTWGYRWNGTAKGADMFKAIVAADDRLFAKIGDFPAIGAAISGLGYDFNYDQQFAVDDPGTQFDEDGLAFGDPIDGIHSVDQDDWYAEGWLDGFWHYSVSIGNPYDGGIWRSSPIGMSNRSLSNGSWDGWTFSPSITFSAFPALPISAPETTTPGDYNRDGKVSAADFTLWRDRLHVAVDIPGASADGNGDGLIDDADFDLWISNYGHAATSSFNSSNVPEPATLDLVALLLAYFAVRTASQLSLGSTAFMKGTR